ncbi:PREDICTED: cyclin-T1-4-like [Fragaria vesca subsp. vesca]|uniref:cyclin-T1-4-like n=1 Tax=Fragaria vesca subsp. vesca TaxID=101020 RepID=UPI0002C2E588|nr:PREDICTED: cyclin-T1-4-like [Fragaria vesca subsp. vesca]
MAGFLPAESSHSGITGMYDGGSSNAQERLEEGSCWYFYRKEIEENSPSRLDGIDLKKETYLRKSYCTFLQDLGMRLKVPQVTIATAIIFCHRFFLRQSHARNDRRTIATVCMFLAGKVEETPRPLKDVILVSYEIIHKKDPAAVQKIKQKEVYEQQKELILSGERVVLATLGFDLNLLHPYKPLVEAIKKFKVAQNALAQVAWNFVNDGLRTSLCLQFKPHHIAAGAIFLAAKFLKVKLPSDGEKVWWQEFDVTPRQLEEVSNQMLELYEQNRAPASNEVEGSTASGATHRAPTKGTASNEEHATRPGTLKSSSSRPASEQSDVDNGDGPPRTMQSQNNDYRSTEMKNASDQNVDAECKDNQHTGPISSHQEKGGPSQSASKFGSEGCEGQENNGKCETREAGELQDKCDRSMESRTGALGQSPHDVIKKIDRNKLKAALEKRRKSQGDMIRKKDLMDEDDLIERELEDGIELAAGSQSRSKPSNVAEHENLQGGKNQESVGYGGTDMNIVEEGEVSAHDDGGQGYQSPKRKAESPALDAVEKRQRRDYEPGTSHRNGFDYAEDHGRRVGHTDRDQKRQAQENHV